MGTDPAQPVGEILDGLGVTQELAEGDLVSAAVVLTRVIDADGEVSLGLASSEGLSGIDIVGMLEVARDICRSGGAVAREIEG